MKLVFYFFLEDEDQSNSRGSDDAYGTSADEYPEQPIVEEEYALLLDLL